MFLLHADNYFHCAPQRAACYEILYSSVLKSEVIESGVTDKISDDWDVPPPRGGSSKIVTAAQ